MSRRLLCTAGTGCLVIGVALADRVSTMPAAATTTARVHPPDQSTDAPPEFKAVRRPGSVDIEATYNLDGLSIPKDEIHTLLPKDAIPALTDPKLEPLDGADWIRDEDRVVDVTINGESVAVPLIILTFHEIANMTVGGEPVAATYCPLCDSVSIFSRRVASKGEGGAPIDRVLEFGVSGALYNSNVLMFDRTDMGLWSQLAMEAVSGPLVGTALKHMPVKVVSFGAFKKAHADGRLVSISTGHQRPYGPGAYSSYFAGDGLLVPVNGIGDALSKKKTLGVGVLDGQSAWFVTAEAIGDGYVLDVDRGQVRLSARDGGVVVESAPEGVRTVQTFYYSWSAFRPETKVVKGEGQ